MADVVISNLVKRFGSTEVLHGIDLDIADGEFIVFVGPSGCGKSTTLRMIAGLEEISDGEISIGGKVVNHLEPKERNIAMVFQNYAIYPHMSVYRNIGFGLRSSSFDRETKDKRIRDTAGLLDLTPLLDRRPSQLSGGQRQRVAIGRAMVRDPAVFLFDEPLSNLDAQLRAQMRLEVKRLHQRLRTTVIFVTHDQVEAMTLADRIAIMRDGNIEQVGTPDELYSKPANTFVAQFVGSPSMNLVPGSIDAAGGLVLPGLDGFDSLHVRGIRAGDVTVGIRPPDLQLATGGEDGASIAGLVEIVERLGHEDLVYFTSGSHSLVAQTSGGTGLSPGDEIRVAAPGHTLHLFDPGTGRALTSA